LSRTYQGRSAQASVEIRRARLRRSSAQQPTAGERVRDLPGAPSDLPVVFHVKRRRGRGPTRQTAQRSARRQREPPWASASRMGSDAATVTRIGRSCPAHTKGGPRRRRWRFGGRGSDAHPRSSPRRAERVRALPALREGARRAGLALQNPLPTAPQNPAPAARAPGTQAPAVQPWAAQEPRAELRLRPARAARARAAHGQRARGRST
jgi:hypothetical protein